MVTCSDCGKPLTGRLDTFGDVGEPLCWDCYAQRNAEESESYYGLGPHRHHFDADGQMATEFLPLTEEDRRQFMPDPDAPGCGVWVREAPPGWR